MAEEDWLELWTDSQFPRDGGAPSVNSRRGQAIQEVSVQCQGSQYLRDGVQLSCFS